MTRIAIVTGSDSGIGKATAVALARAGYAVGITWHEDEDGAEATASEVRSEGRQAEVRRLDLNNAGTGDSSAFLDVELDKWRHILEVDLTGAFVCGQAAAKLMVGAGRGGRI